MAVCVRSADSRWESCLTARNLSDDFACEGDGNREELKQHKHLCGSREVGAAQGRRLERLSLDGRGVVMEGRRFYPKAVALSVLASLEWTIVGWTCVVCDTRHT